MGRCLKATLQTCARKKLPNPQMKLKCVLPGNSKILQKNVQHVLANIILPGVNHEWYHQYGSPCTTNCIYHLVSHILLSINCVVNMLQNCNFVGNSNKNKTVTYVNLLFSLVQVQEKEQSFCFGPKQNSKVTFKQTPPPPPTHRKLVRKFQAS